MISGELERLTSALNVEVRQDVSQEPMVHSATSLHGSGVEVTGNGIDLRIIGVLRVIWYQGPGTRVSYKVLQVDARGNVEAWARALMLLR